jgi:heme-degrading monooxygenase HmoA
MYARMVKLTLRPGKTEEITQVVRDVIIPALKEQPGFIGQLFLTRQEQDSAISINWWETESEMAAFESSALYRDLMGKIKDTLAGPPDGLHYQVGAETRLLEKV